MNISRLELNKEYTWREICELVGFKYSTDGKTQKRQLKKLRESENHRNIFFRFSAEPE